jgi:hypothetical protein
MTLERTTYANGQTVPTATACPLCEEPIGKQQSLATHLAHSCPEN